MRKLAIVQAGQRTKFQLPPIENSASLRMCSPRDCSYRLHSMIGCNTLGINMKMEAQFGGSTRFTQIFGLMHSRASVDGLEGWGRGRRAWRSKCLHPATSIALCTHVQSLLKGNQDLWRDDVHQRLLAAVANMCPALLRTLQLTLQCLRNAKIFRTGTNIAVLLTRDLRKSPVGIMHDKRTSCTCRMRPVFWGEILHIARRHDSVCSGPRRVSVPRHRHSYLCASPHGSLHSCRSNSWTRLLNAAHAVTLRPARPPSRRPPSRPAPRTSWTRSTPWRCRLWWDRCR